MTGKERIITALQLGTPDRVPTFEWFIDTTVGKALTGNTDPIEIVDALDIDGINIRPDYSQNFIDESTFLDEWGIKRKLTGDCIPCVIESPIKDITTHADYEFPDPKAPHRFASLEKTLNYFGDKRAVILNLRDGFSDMRDLLGYEEALVQLMLEPGHYSNLLNRVIDFNLELARAACSRYGIKIIATTDDVANADGLLIPPEKYFEIIGPAFKRVIKGYRDLGCYVIKHCDGDVSKLIDFWINCGINCLDPIDPSAGLKIDDFKMRFGEKICLKGNINCAGSLQYGTESDVEKEVKECIIKGGKSGLILSSSNTIHRGVKPGNYLAMLRTLRCTG
ncbi:MAG: uroporphyrinogen decarboxylase family protein [Kiritimatiellae bacterium]|nr:uroporphyrinogen decarboxylase family protein [Kiritimatiellia bacterium]MDD5522408.1 uroporphyrinogen decarboxylase family protein [Kiritimatiellia bacterium]